MLEFYLDKTTQFINTLALDLIQVLDSRKYFQSTLNVVYTHL